MDSDVICSAYRRCTNPKCDHRKPHKFRTNCEETVCDNIKDTVVCKIKIVPYDNIIREFKYGLQAKGN